MRLSARTIQNLYSTSVSTGRFASTDHLRKKSQIEQNLIKPQEKYQGKAFAHVFRVTALSTFQFPRESADPIILTVSPGFVCGTFILNRHGTFPISASVSLLAAIVLPFAQAKIFEVSVIAPFRNVGE